MRAIANCQHAISGCRSLHWIVFAVRSIRSAHINTMKLELLPSNHVSYVTHSWINESGGLRRPSYLQLVMWRSKVAWTRSHHYHHHYRLHYRCLYKKKVAYFAQTITRIHLPEIERHKNWYLGRQVALQQESTVDCVRKQFLHR